MVGRQDNTLLSSYSNEVFISFDSWHILRGILSRRTGVTLGLSGPRGAGKTWLMQRSIEWARKEGGLGIHFPSPSEYEATAFMASLSDMTASAFQEYYDELLGLGTKASRFRYHRRVYVALLCYIAGYCMVYLGLEYGRRGVHSYLFELLVRILNPISAIGLLLLIGGVAMYSIAFREQRRERTGLGKMRARAEELRLQVRYSATTKELMELGGEAKYGGVIGRLKQQHERQLVERPATLSALIHNFRTFANGIAKELNGPCVIAVDELDKMTDPERVAQLLRDIKGIFEIPGVHFLVSISDEAARFLELSTVRARNEFNSSFYSLLVLPPLSPSDCIKLLQVRASNVEEITALTVALMSGGVAREVVRLADLVHRQSLRNRVSQIVFTILREELHAFREHVANMPSYPGDRRKLAVLQCLPDVALRDADQLKKFGACALTAWDAPVLDGADGEIVLEEWRRLLVRLAIGYIITCRQELLHHMEPLTQLQLVVRLNAGSAAVGRAKLAQFLVQQMSDREAASESLSDIEVRVISQAVAAQLDGSGTRMLTVPKCIKDEQLQRMHRLGLVRSVRRGFKREWLIQPIRSFTRLPPTK